MKNKKPDCGKISKPQLSGFSHQYGKKTILMGVVSAAIGGILFKIFFVDRRRSAVKKFYENYDIDKEFETMRSKNLFDSC